MKRKILITTFLAVILSLNSFANTFDSGTDHITRVVSPFQILTVYDNINVILVDGASSNITIEGNQKEVRSIKIEQRENQVIIRKKDFTSMKSTVVVYVTVNNLRSLEVIGNARVFSSGEIHSDFLWVKLAGNGEVNLKADVPKVLTTSWASGTISISGDYCTSSTFRSDSGPLVTSYSKNCGTAMNDEK